MGNKVCDHTSVGIIVKQGDELLLIERRKPPFGFASPAGHVDGDESYETAARRELYEETGLQAFKLKLVYESDMDNPCRRVDGAWHHWKVYEAEATGSPRRSLEETKQLCWVSPGTLQCLIAKAKRYKAGDISDVQWHDEPGLEQVWYDIYKAIGMIA